MGIFHTPEQFVEKALQLQHPMDSANPLWECTRKTLQLVKESTPEAISLMRKTNLLKAKLLQKQLAGQERELHQKLHPSVQTVVADKNILPWRTLLETHGFDDMGVVELLTEGTRLVGVCPKPDCFEPKVKPATLSEEQLRASAVWRRKAIMQSKRTALSSEPEHVSHLDDASEEEVKLGFMEGPFSEAEVTAKLGHPDWCLFILDQGGGKLRPIDDALESQLNTAFTATIRLDLQTSDYVAALALKVAEVANQPRSRHAEWVGKCLDLSKAYKQMPLHPEHRDRAVVWYRGAEGEDKFYLCNSLLFGASASVFAFIRVSRSLSFLLNKVALIPSSVFFDDFPLFTPSSSGEEADQGASELLDLLGWRYAKSGKKGLPFSKAFDVLGLNCTSRP